MVLDHAGVIHIYADSDRFRNVLEGHGLEERVEALITDAGYWSQQPADGAAMGEEFRRALGLTATPGPDESHEAGAVY